MTQRTISNHDRIVERGRVLLKSTTPSFVTASEVDSYRAPGSGGRGEAGLGCREKPKRVLPAAFRGGTVSIGVSTFDGAFPYAPETLVQKSDLALYEAKCRRRNCCVFLRMDDAGV
jgi:GGDEF domain-containing protein